MSIVPNFKNNKHFYVFDHGKLLLKGLRRSTRDIELRHHIARSCPKKVPIWMQLAKAMMANTGCSQIVTSDFTSNPVAYCNLFFSILQNLECTSVCEHRARWPFVLWWWPDSNCKSYCCISLTISLQNENLSISQSLTIHKWPRIGKIFILKLDS